MVGRYCTDVPSDLEHESDSTHDALPLTLLHIQEEDARANEVPRCGSKPSPHDVDVAGRKLKWAEDGPVLQDFEVRITHPFDAGAVASTSLDGFNEFRRKLDDGLDELLG